MGVTRPEPMKWVAEIEHEGFLNMLWVPHFICNIINTIYVHQFLVLIHDRCLWLGGTIPIDDMLVHKITLLPY